MRPQAANPGDPDPTKSQPLPLGLSHHNLSSAKWTYHSPTGKSTFGFSFF
jgi:hypothetical protein